MPTAFPKTVLLVGAALLTGCGYVGNPQAPTLDMPQRVKDLRAVEYGSKIIVEFTIPPETTEGLPLASVRSLDLRIGPAPQNWSDNAWADAAKKIDCPVIEAGAVSCSAPESAISAWVGKDVIIRVRATGPKGKTSEWSANKILAVQTPQATPADLKVANLPTGLSLSWKSPAAHFRVFRLVGEGTPEQVAETTEPTWLDPNVEFGTSYRYYVQSVDGDEHQSETAQSQPAQRVDDFTPAVPQGLTAQQGPSTIELSWERNTEARFQGYNVFRSVDGAAEEKVASLVTAPTYSDRAIELGKKYVYRVSAVGINGKESARSAPYSIAAQ